MPVIIKQIINGYCGQKGKMIRKVEVWIQNLKIYNILRRGNDSVINLALMA